MDTATFEESLGDEFELYKNDGKSITYYRNKKAMKASTDPYLIYSQNPSFTHRKA